MRHVFTQTLRCYLLTIIPRHALMNTIYKLLEVAKISNRCWTEALLPSTSRLGALLPSPTKLLAS
jgi:hypothetical protein